MQEDVENTGFVLIRFLRALHVKVSRMTVCRLLDNPLGNSLRGMSDALDMLHIDNAVYQLPVEYFNKLESPFIAVINDKNAPFCLVERSKDTDIIITVPRKNIKVSRQQFLRKWTGAVLVGEVTEKTIQEKAFQLKNIGYWILHYKLLLATIMAIMLILYDIGQEYPTGLLLYLITLCLGVLVSSAILYKELINTHFLNRFCHVGEVIDCNKILHYKGSRIMGMGLGEMSLVYFTTLLLYTLIRPYDFYGFSLICNAVAIAFTIYSVICQLFIIRKGCVLCMLINLIVWSNCVILYILHGQTDIVFSVRATLYLVVIGFICFVGWLQIKTLLKANDERKQLRSRLSALLKPEIFRKIVSETPQIREIIDTDITLHTDSVGKNHLMFIINPNCKNCAKVHADMQRLPSDISLSLIFLTSMNDSLGESIAQIIITAYLSGGWNKAMQQLGKWYGTKNIKDMYPYSITSEAEEIWKKQQMYCREQKIDRTPYGIVNGYCVPDLYLFSELKYVL